LESILGIVEVHMTNGTWVVVADACRARVFVDHGQREGLEERTGFTRPGGREHVRDRVSDRSGMKPAAGGLGVRAGLTPEVDPKEAEARAFARFLADNLKRHRNHEDFKDLVLAAPPHFLGLLRAALDETVSRRVVASFDKDYITLDAPELARRIMVLAKA
jgi:protein required for attachment to host cells